MASESPGTDPDLLDGWKAIADYLGKSIRTAQRWRNELELPIYRVGGREGENVYAFRSELDTWRRRSPNGPSGRNGNSDPELDTSGSNTGRPADGSASFAGNDSGELAALTPNRAWSRRRLGALVATTLVLAAAVLAGVAWFRPDIVDLPWLPSSAQPARYRVADRTLFVFDSQDRELWHHEFPFDLNNISYREYEDDARMAEPDGRSDIVPNALEPLVNIADIDGDGRREVLFMSYRTSEPRSDALFCFDHDGRMLWQYASTHPVNFGNKYFGPLDFGIGVHVSVDDGGKPTIWAHFDHRQWFPSVLVKLDAQGRTRGEYWANGRICTVSFATIAGKSLVLVGGPSNDMMGGALAVFEQDRFGGSSPAVRPDYQCLNCPPGEPKYFMVFPRTDISVSKRNHAAVYYVLLTAEGKIEVSVLHDMMPNTPDGNAGVCYTLNSQFRVLRSEYLGRYGQLHDIWFKQGRLDHAFDPDREESQLWPVLRWNGKSYDTITGPER
jgi:hypothetical protein